jgi:hypothetical protein
MPAKKGYDPYADVERAQQLSREGVEGYGEALRPHLMREIGNALGGLNEIGALRSGGANVALNDITTNYAQQIGAYAKQASGNALGYGLEAQKLRMERQKEKDRKRAGLFKAIGSVLGAGVGFLVGGPAGAVAGAGVGGSLGGGSEASDASYGGGYA